MNNLRCVVHFFKESGKLYTEEEFTIPENIKSHQLRDYIDNETCGMYAGTHLVVVEYKGMREDFIYVPFMIPAKYRS